jgi:hypothetical protein
MCYEPPGGIEVGSAVGHGAIHSERKQRDAMWGLFSRRRVVDNELYASLRPGDLYGADNRGGSQWEPYLRYLLLGNAAGLTFFAIVVSQVTPQTPAHEAFVTATWLTVIGAAIAATAQVMLMLSRREEAKALANRAGTSTASDLPPAVHSLMKKAAIKKLLAFRVMMVSGLSLCIAIYLGAKGLYLL